LSIIERAVRGVSYGALQLAAAACLICFALMCYGVAMRYLLGAPQPWIDKVLGWLVVAIVMLAAPAAHLEGEHVAVDTLSERLRGRPRRALAAFSLLWVVAMAAVMIWEGWGMVAFSRLQDVMSDLHPIRIWWIQVLIPIGFGLVLVVALAQLLRVARGLDLGDAAADAEARRIKAGPLE
jgi:TRAP-type C4-dicarboxylate transport system permease small subunit